MDMERNGCSLIKVLSWHFLAGTEEKQERPYSKKPVSRQSYYSATSLIKRSTNHLNVMLFLYLF
jgi:hypothetical protein